MIKVRRHSVPIIATLTGIVMLRSLLMPLLTLLDVFQRPYVDTKPSSGYHGYLVRTITSAGCIDSESNTRYVTITLSSAL